MRGDYSGVGRGYSPIYGGVAQEGRYNYNRTGRGALPQRIEVNSTQRSQMMQPITTQQVNVHGKKRR